MSVDNDDTFEPQGGPGRVAQVACLRATWVA